MRIRSTLKRVYVATMMRVVGRGLAIASRVDNETADEVSRLPAELTIAMRVYPQGPCCLWQRTGAGLNYLGTRESGAADLQIIFKHLEHAWLLFTFQENTPTAFARNRLVVDGDLAGAAVFNRCLARLLTLILPCLVATRAVKRYPCIALRDKLRLAVSIYLRIPMERTRPAL
jgi:hypothetical protein